jgi:hypothetical protein
MYLADSDKNKDVRSIASVSGGSLTNGYVAQELRFDQTSGPSFEEAVRPFAARLAQSGTFMDAELTPAFSRMLLVTFAIAAVPAWFLPAGRWVCLLVAVGLVGVWAILVLRHLFATRLGQAYGVLLATTLYGGAVGPWLVRIPSVLCFALFLGAIALWASTVVGLRGRVCAHAFLTTLFSPKGRPTRLADIPRDIDHVFCATDLQSAEHAYFSASFVYGYRYGKGTPADLPLHTVVQASAALPGAFPPKWLPTRDHRFAYDPDRPDCPKQEHRLSKVPGHMVLVDGGVYDNMADQWAQGFEGRTRCWSGLADEHHEPEELIVVNASAGLPMRSMKRAWIPIFGELAALSKDKDVLYDQTTAIRRHGLVGRFDRAELQGSGMRGALVHIAQSPFDVATAFKDSVAWPGRAVRANALIGMLGDTEGAWDRVAQDNAGVKTTLSRHGIEVSARLLHHAYVLAMANLHVVLGYPLLQVPSRERFEQLVS